MIISYQFSLNHSYCTDIPGLYARDRLQHPHMQLTFQNNLTLNQAINVYATLKKNKQ